MGNQCSTFDSPRDHHQGIHPCAPQRERGSVPQTTRSGTLLARDDKQNRCAGRPLTMSSIIPVEIHRILWLNSKDSNSTNSLLPNHFWFRRYDPKHWSQVVLIFRRKLCHGSKVFGKDFPNFEILDAKIVLNKIIQNSHFKKRVSLEEQKTQKEDRFPRGRHIAFMI